MATIKIPPVLRPSVGGEKEVQAGGDDVGAVLRALAEQHPATAVAAVRRRRVSSTATSTSTSTTRTSACSTGSTPSVGESDTLVILPAMAGGAYALAARSSRLREASY